VTSGRLARTPFYFIGSRPYREAELAAYMRREHRRGRHLDEIVQDPYVARCGGPSLLRAALGRPDLIRAMWEDAAEAIRAGQAELPPRRLGRGAPPE
jgi:hypothetical protein